MKDLVAAVAVLRRYGVPADTQELLIHGNPRRDVMPGALEAVIASIKPPGDVDLPWLELPFQTVKAAAAITGRSPAGCYSLMHKGDIVARRLGGKTLITTDSLIAFLKTATPWDGEGKSHD